MTEAAFVPSGLPQGVLNLVQQNKLAGRLLKTLIGKAAYRNDFTRVRLEPGQGSTLTTNRLGRAVPDLLPASSLGDVDVLSFGSEQFTAAPVSYGKKVLIDAPTSYIQLGNQAAQKIDGLATWGAMTLSRLARARAFKAAGYGFAMIRRAQTTGHSVLLVNSCGGFRYKWVNGQPIAVSASNTLQIEIVAATTFTALVTGVTPLDARYPDGPGELTLSTTLSANVAAGSYCYIKDAKPYIVRPNSRASSDALTTTDLPTMAEIRAMKAKFEDQGVPVHEDTGTYHMHVPASFFDKVGADTAYRQATQGMGVSPQLGPGAYFSPNLGITFITNSDSPAKGKTDPDLIYSVGAASHSGSGGTGTAGSNECMVEVGLDVINYSGVRVERAIMTGGGMGDETYIDEMLYYEQMGIKPLGMVTQNVGAYQMSEGGMQFLSADIAGLRLTITPPLDPRALVCTVSLSATLDFTAHTDVDSLSDKSDLRPYKRTIMLEYGVPS